MTGQEKKNEGKKRLVGDCQSKKKYFYEAGAVAREEQELRDAVRLTECAGFPPGAAICHTHASELLPAMKSDIIIVSSDTKV